MGRFTTESTESTEDEECSEEEGVGSKDPESPFLSGLCALCVSVVKTSILPQPTMRQEAP